MRRIANLVLAMCVVCVAGQSVAFAASTLTPSPIMSPDGGDIATGAPVTITDAAGGAAIYYTTNGTTPTTTSTHYSGPIPVSSTEDIECVAIAPDMTISQLASKRFTVVPAPTITSITPASGPVGSSVTINGQGFVEVGKVCFGGVPATTYSVTGSSVIAVVVPTGASAGAITVAAVGGAAASASSFSLQSAPASPTAPTATVAPAAPPTFTPGTDITSTLKQVISTATGQSPISVQIPAGTYFLSSTLTFPANVPVRIAGSGEYTTILQETKDLGAGVYAIDANPTSTCAISISDLTLKGGTVGVSSGSPDGIAPAMMYGIHATDQAEISDCSIGGFYAGIVMDGNHHIVQNCYIENNYYGLYWIQSSDSTYFDDYVGLCQLGGNRFASVACAATGQIGCFFERDHTGYEPFAFYREPGANNNWLSCCHFIQCELEGVGYADFYDGSEAASISGCTFEDCWGFGSNYGYIVPAANVPLMPTAVELPSATGPAMVVGTFNGNTVIGAGPEPGNMQALAVYNNSWSLEDIAYTIEMGNLAAPLGVTNLYNNVIHDGATTLTLYSAKSAVSAGQPVEIGSCTHGDPYSVQPAAGVAPVAGVALTTAAAGACTFVGTKGVFTLADPAATTFTLNQPVDVLAGGSLATSGGALVGSCTGTTSGGVYAWVNSYVGP